MANNIQIHGLDKLIRSLKNYPEDVREEFVWALEEAANPVRMSAQRKAPGTLRNMPRTPEWAAMRVGITRRSPPHVWVAPALRGKVRPLRGRAKDVFVQAIQGEALDPALAENTNEVFRRVDGMLGQIANRNDF